MTQEHGRKYNSQGTKIIILDRGSQESWGMFPKFLDRVKFFCSKYDTDTDGSIICRLLEMHFVSDNPQFIMLAAVNGDRIIGHALSSIEVYYGKRVLVIIQLELDQKIVRDELDKGFEAILSWGRVQGAEDVRILTGTKSKARMFKRFYNFKPHRIVMVRPLLGEGV